MIDRVYFIVHYNKTVLHNALIYGYMVFFLLEVVDCLTGLTGGASDKTNLRPGL